MMCASYPARMWGSTKPELSTTRMKALVQFMCEWDTFQLDWGHVTGNQEEGRQAGGAVEEV